MELILLFFGSFGAVIVLFLFYSGYFNPVLFKTQTLPQYYLALRPLVGDYKNSPSIQAELMQELVDGGLVIDTTAGIYFDNPKELEKDKLRSLVGVVIKAEQLDLFKALHSDARLVELEEQKAFHTSWNYKSGLSIMLAIMRVYPAIFKRAKRDHFEIFQSIEIYDFSQKRLDYYFPKQTLDSLWEVNSSN